MRLARFGLISVILALVSSPLAAAGPGNLSRLDRQRANGCTLTVADAGTAMLIEAKGLIPGESYRFTLINGDMPPIAFAAYANAEGRFAQYYVPFRFSRDGGVVAVRVTAANCTLRAEAAWSRGVPVIG